ncbi:MAG: imidazole glycerol phosphate synthase subunit HisH, partial [Flammeovirgaceae bacterium]
SVKKKLTRLKVAPMISSNPKDIERADKLILPGVGHFQKAMENLAQLNLLDALHEVVLEKKKPVLGICLGMQLMTNKSEEGAATGLGWIDAEVVRFNVQHTKRFKVPHMGWNSVINRKESVLMNGLPEKTSFYFVHAYHCIANRPEDVLHETTYEYTFTSAFERENIFGVQYHPEKSHDIGELLLKNFINL